MTAASRSDDERAIRDVVARWFDASRRGDTQTVLSLMCDDAVFLVPGREPFGKEVFRQTSRDMSGVRIEGGSEIQELRVLGDWAFTRSHATVTMTPQEGVPITRAGHILTIFRKEPDGHWRVARDANLLAVQNPESSSSAVPSHTPDSRGKARPSD
jgi:uncharacterized protein (TIGR02246 family)